MRRSWLSVASLWLALLMASRLAASAPIEVRPPEPVSGESFSRGGGLAGRGEARRFEVARVGKAIVEVGAIPAWEGRCCIKIVDEAGSRSLEERESSRRRAQDTFDQLYRAPLDPKAVTLLDLTGDTSTAVAIRDSSTLGKRSRLEGQVEVQGLGRSIRATTRTLIVLGHIEGTDFVVGDSHERIALQTFTELAGKRDLHLILLGCNSARVAQKGSGVAGKFNSVDAVGRLASAMEAPNWGRFYDRLAGRELLLELRTGEIAHLHDIAVRDAASGAEVGRVLFRPPQAWVAESSGEVELFPFRGVLETGLLLAVISALVVFRTRPTTRERRLASWGRHGDEFGEVAVLAVAGLVGAGLVDGVDAIFGLNSDRVNWSTVPQVLVFLGGMMATAYALGRLKLRGVLGLLLMIGTYVLLGGGFVYLVALALLSGA
jgi:hypothetical protein